MTTVDQQNAVGELGLLHKPGVNVSNAQLIQGTQVQYGNGRLALSADIPAQVRSVQRHEYYGSNFSFVATIVPVPPRKRGLFLLFR